MAFGQSASLYDETRQLYTNEAIEKIVELIGSNTADLKILDVGCGTGIATRQLADYGLDVIGTDVDNDMISQAQLKSSPENYHIMRTDNMDFDDETFDAITAFGAFHWFNDDDSVKEIKRVLKPGGRFIIVNKNDTSDFRHQIVKIVSHHANVKFSEAKTAYYPENILKANLFKKIGIVDLNSTELLSLENAVMHAQTMRLWQEIPLHMQPIITNELQQHIVAQVKMNGLFERPINTRIVSGIKNQVILQKKP